jgi:hypothetical protein
MTGALRSRDVQLARVGQPHWDQISGRTTFDNEASLVDWNCHS